MQKIYRHFCIVVLILLALTACSSEPSDNLLLDLFKSNMAGLFRTRDIHILHKGKCEPISATAKAKGVDEAWLVGFDYQYELSDNTWINNRSTFFICQSGWRVA
jgi:hypothetical protein